MAKMETATQRGLAAPRMEATDSGRERVTLAEVRHLLGGISEVTFYRWLKQGFGPKHLTLPSGKRMFFRRDVEEWLAANVKPPQVVQ